MLIALTMKNKSKKFKNPYLLFVPILLGFVVLFLIDWFDGPHTGTVDPPFEYCGHTLGRGSLHARIPYFHCAGDAYPFFYALVRFIGFWVFIIVYSWFYIGAIIAPILAFGFVTNRTKNILYGMISFIVCLVGEIGLFLYFT